MDKLGNTDKYTRKILSLVKAIVPRMAQGVIDRAMQVLGGLGTSDLILVTSISEKCYCLQTGLPPGAGCAQSGLRVRRGGSPQERRPPPRGLHP